MAIAIIVGPFSFGYWFVNSMSIVKRYFLIAALHRLFFYAIDAGNDV